jgi:hypothetical protein
LKKRKTKKQPEGLLREVIFCLKVKKVAARLFKRLRFGVDFIKQFMPYALKFTLCAHLFTLI